jgi:hypothetical protein
VGEIAQSARRSGLDFIILNDHDYMTDGLHLEEEGFYGEVLVLRGLEVGGRYHHYLAYDLKAMVQAGSASPQEVIDAVKDQGGFGFLAHPFEKGMPFHEKSVAYTWNDLSVDGYQGICIWNFTSRWKERVRSGFHGLFFLLFKVQMLKGPSRQTLRFWDQTCQEKRVAAIGGSDAHGTSFRSGAIRFTPLRYDFLLNSINVHLLTDKPCSKPFNRAKQTVYTALREGRVFVAHENLAPARGFRFDYRSEGGDALTMGEEAPFEPGALSVSSPRHGEIRVLRNGEVLRTWSGRGGTVQVREKGVYRVEVFLRLRLFGWRPWIFSNPIYLR